MICIVVICLKSCLHVLITFLNEVIQFSSCCCCGRYFGDQINKEWNTAAARTQHSKTVVVLMEYIPSILYLWDPSNHIEHFPSQRVNQMFSTTCTFSILQKNPHTFGTKVLDEPCFSLVSGHPFVEQQKFGVKCRHYCCWCYRVVKGGVPRGGGSLIFPNVP